jgi:endonuclease/exonuclease/phosphatase family metal-dependent hydrolase
LSHDREWPKLALTATGAAKDQLAATDEVVAPPAPVARKPQAQTLTQRERTRTRLGSLATCRLVEVMHEHREQEPLRTVRRRRPSPEAKRANELRKHQCEVAANIIASVTRPNSPYVVLGDMNDPPDSEFLAPVTQSHELKLVSGLANATETRAGPGSPPPPTIFWTERFKASGKPAEYILMDQVWLSPALAAKRKAGFI